MKQQDLHYWEELAERYFLAETTEEEEMLLRQFLCTVQARDARFDEIRATLGYVHVCQQNRHTPALGRRLKVAGIAACISAVTILGWYQYQRQNVCSVRIAGQTVEEADASELMQRQMTEMFSTSVQ